MLFNRKQSISLCLSLFFVISLFVCNTVLAQSLTGEVIGQEGLVPDSCKGNAQGCGLSDFFNLLTNLFKLILGLLGSLGLFFFIYGGFTWMLSRGNQQMVQKGKDIITGAVIGITIVMASWVITNIVIILLTTGDFSKPGEIFNTEWSNPFSK